MTRFCGSLDWGTPGPSVASWPSMLALLGEGAVDCSPEQRSQIHLGVWSPERRRPTGSCLVADGDVSVLFSGYLRDPPLAAEGEAHGVLARYRAGDWSWLRHANGVFAVAVVDARDDRCVLAVDRLGIRPLFYVQDETGVAFGEDLAAVAARCWGRLELDYDTLQELMALGFPLSARTFLRNAERVPPGTLIELGRGRRSATRYWSLESLPPILRQDTEVFLDESQMRLRGALQPLLARSSPGALCLLSSGYDSRRLLLEGHAVGARFAAVTAVWPYPGREGTTIEPAVTEELCARLGLPHRLVALPGEPGVMGSGAARALRDTLLDFQVYGRHHIWAMPLAASLAPSDERWNFDGMAGDTFFNNPFYALPRPMWGRWRPDPELLEAIVPHHDQWDRMWDGLVSRSLASRLRDALDALPEGSNRLSFFYLLGRTRAVVALLPYGLLNLRVESFCPYLDNEVMEHALTFDPVAKGELRLQALALQRHFPDFAGIPSSHSPPSEVPAPYLHALELADPDFVGRLTTAEVLRLLRARVLAPRRPRFGPKDLAFAASRSVGLRWPGGRWREPRVRDLVHTASIVTLFGHGTLRSMVQARARARAALERYGTSLGSDRGHLH